MPMTFLEGLTAQIVQCAAMTKVNWELLVQMAIGLLAVVIAVAAWRTSIQALRSTYRPLLRPVPLRETGKPVSGMDFKVKNIGAGPAIGVMLVDLSGPTTILTEVSVVEPLRDPTATGEAGRVGSVRLTMLRGSTLEKGHTYRLLYQDMGGTWHETRFIATETGFTPRFLGPKYWWHCNRTIPSAVKARGQVVERAEPF